ncbi:unnamed protein product [Cyberlindnera jadinii]|uniref:Uncharacterized protein n=1 Tax=Cyberlindnera jadinii (strain ATCC 18201 / CBS 1600 / BCRC 20928 / JCM 3617 / NBRC 0987 / NRRL Y-1542) TaxID=983966 RepID=A0A0H5C016_CYBJN|nr:unnamed protein product [Cyberlindnera jadinii]
MLHAFYWILRVTQESKKWVYQEMLKRPKSFARLSSEEEHGAFRVSCDVLYLEGRLQSRLGAP